MHHLARLADHRISGVVVGQAEDQASTLDDLRQVQRVFQSRGQRLIADDVNSGFKKSFGGSVMQIVGRDDADNLDAVVPLRFGSSHLRKAAIRARNIQLSRPREASLLQLRLRRSSNSAWICIWAAGVWLK